MKAFFKWMGTWLQHLPEESAHKPIVYPASDVSPGDAGAEPPAPESKIESAGDFALLTEMFGDDQEARREVLSAFLVAVWEGVAEIESAYKNRDWAGVGDSGHKLRAPAGTVGADRLADLCEEIEKAGEAGDQMKIEQLMVRLRPMVEAAEAFIRERE